MAQGEPVNAHCNVCAGFRSHIVINFHEEKWREPSGDDPPAFVWGEDIYELLKCVCGNITLRHTNLFSENVDAEGPVPWVTYYPPATLRREPKWLDWRDVDGTDESVFASTPEFIYRLLREIYGGLQARCLSLAAMGVRALVERVRIDRVGDRGSFPNNLKHFQEQGYISKRQKETLDVVLDVGHAAIHRNYNPSWEDLTHVLDITENVIEAFYVSDLKAASVKRRIPARPRRS